MNIHTNYGIYEMQFASQQIPYLGGVNFGVMTDKFSTEQVRVRI